MDRVVWTESCGQTSVDSGMTWQSLASHTLFCSSNAPHIPPFHTTIRLTSLIGYSKGGGGRMKRDPRWELFPVFGGGGWGGWGRTLWVKGLQHLPLSPSLPIFFCDTDALPYTPSTRGSPCNLLAKEEGGGGG
eukprot:Sspe_Gene.87397::Locus_58601_Transcript_1_1_Confidence_1.000_Length_510::g.87397::m.87397